MVPSSGVTADRKSTLISSKKGEKKDIKQGFQLEKNISPKVV